MIGLEWEPSEGSELEAPFVGLEEEVRDIRRLFGGTFWSSRNVTLRFRKAVASGGLRLGTSGDAEVSSG